MFLYFPATPGTSQGSSLSSKMVDFIIWLVNCLVGQLISWLVGGLVGWLASKFVG